ncbi:MAG: exosortase O [Candidatus Magasanikbacteria bacterium]|nr:exosortase O [Candidatus Magasanikbacteria bacterium]
MTKIFLQKNKEYIKDGVVILLFFLYFRSNVIWTYNYFSQAASYEYVLLFLISLIVLWIATKGTYSFRKENSVSRSIFLIFFGAILVDLINIFYLHYQIISASAMIIGVYALLGMYIERQAWKRGFFIVGIIALSLPFAEHIQTFLGFPIRLFTAKIVSSIMGLIGLISVSDASVIITENNATSIDVPCSGIKSIYTGAIVLLTMFFLKRVRWSLKLLAIAIVYFLLLLSFNIWRVFSLVYIYDVLSFPAFGNAIHIGIGIMGFIVSTFLLWYLIDKFVIKAVEQNDVQAQKERSYKKLYFIILLLIALILDTSYIIFRTHNPQQIQSPNIVFKVPNLELQEMPFNQQENLFFVNREIEFSKKYTGETKSGRAFSLLLVSSKSWRDYHNPELCLQGIGYKIDDSKIMQLANLRIRKLSLNDGKDTVLYWFVNKNKSVMDYSERVWEGIKNPEQVWTLVEVGFQGSVDLNNSDIVGLLEYLHASVKQL